MPDKVIASINKMQDALSRIPGDAAERVAHEAAVRAEAIADYVESVEKKGVGE